MNQSNIFDFKADVDRQFAHLEVLEFQVML